MFLFCSTVLKLVFFAGPNLNGLFGRQSGTTPGYSYSAANKTKAVIWEEKTLYDYLLNPKKVLVFDKAKVSCKLIEILQSCLPFYRAL